ncbi:hypothetical protein BDF22DRAFT_148784 [Syncephalis plumigaleata]|nr:hypothetical protein BDF22DRAFT_148784 [Syncephalis plumigaleata]
MMAFLGFVRKSFNSSTSTNIRTQNAMAHIITKWSQQIPQQIWTEFIPMLIHATYEYADNRGMIMIWRTISHIWMKVPTIIPIAVEGVMKIINKQNSDSRAIVTEQDMQTQLCNRLCPLLILKTMPNEVFDHAKMESNENTMNMIANLRE